MTLFFPFRRPLAQASASGDSQRSATAASGGRADRQCLLTSSFRPFRTHFQLELMETQMTCDNLPFS